MIRYQLRGPESLIRALHLCPKGNRLLKMKDQEFQNLQEENELLLLQLHQVQEELDSIS